MFGRGAKKLDKRRNGRTGTELSSKNRKKVGGEKELVEDGKTEVWGVKRVARRGAHAEPFPDPPKKPAWVP